MALTDAAPTQANKAVELMGIGGTGANSFGCTDVWARGTWVRWLAAGCASMSRRASET